MLKYNVEISDSAKKFIKNIDGSLTKRVDTFLLNLEINPIPKDKKHILETHGPSMLCEGTIDKLRFYYTIEDKFVVVEDIKYRGSVEVIQGKQNHKSGSRKNFSNQRRDISKLKKWFNNLFKIHKK